MDTGEVTKKRLAVLRDAGAPHRSNAGPREMQVEGITASIGEQAFLIDTSDAIQQTSCVRFRSTSEVNRLMRRRRCERV
ncbi:hypothetical protein [Paraburkholderia sp. MM5482-R1]|uniref:hypothetical protein n=1 Tax=unclassified Paraburkholderia TaxID=2615204 RepID=UPI003D1A463C